MKMKAAVHTRYGPPEVVKIEQVKVPFPKENEVLIKVQATSVNRTDCGFRSAEYFISRFFSGLFQPSIKIWGSEFAGIIESTGKGVSSFKVGDRVFGFNDSRFGAHAEYMVMSENEAIGTIPDNLTFHEAAALTEGAHYALNNIRAVKVKVGQHVMVYGATGAIGSAAVQLLKYFGANVTAVCNTQNMDLVQSLGADRVIDYTKEDYTNTRQIYDWVFDAVGKSSFKKVKPILAEKGIYISTEFGKNGINVGQAIITPFLGGKKVLFPIPTINKEDVKFIRDLAENGRLKPVIDRQYALDDIVEAYRYVETGQKIGNVIISIH